MTSASDSAIMAIQQLEKEAAKQLRLVEAFELLAKAEEEAAAALQELDLPREADEMLTMAASHFRRAAEETRRAKQKRQQEIKLLNDTSK